MFAPSLQARQSGLDPVSALMYLIIFYSLALALCAQVDLWVSVLWS
jgi:hypothetical protein